MRLDRFIGNATDYSRSEIKKMIRARRISVNGAVQVDAALHVEAKDEVLVDGDPARAPSARYFMLNKPVGYVSETKDRLNPSVVDLLDEPNMGKLHVAGRLDIDTTGLVLLTDDGQWSHRVTSPNHRCGKTYYVAIDSVLSEEHEKKITAGLWLNNEDRRTLPAEIERICDNEFRLTIYEGKYHQVKRMFAAVGHRVEKLHRERIGNIVLDDSLESGKYRELTEAEINSFKE